MQRQSAHILCVGLTSVLILLFGWEGRAAEPFDVSTSLDRASLEPFLEVLEDPQATLQFEAVVAGRHTDRLHPPRDGMRLGMADGARWFRFALRNASDERADMILTVGTDATHSVELVSGSSPATMGRIERSGNVVAPEDRPLRTAVPSFFLSISSRSVETYTVRISSPATQDFPVYLSTDKIYFRNATEANWWQGLLFGILAALAAYNLILVFTTREVIYAYYAGQTVAVCVLLAALTGVDFEMWHFGGDRLLRMWSGMAATGFLGAQYTRHFLQTRGRSGPLDTLLRGLGWLCIALFPAMVFGSQVVGQVVLNALLGLLVLLFVVAGVVRFREGFRPARLFLLSWSLPVVFIAPFPLLFFIPSLFSYTGLDWFQMLVGVEIAMASERVLSSFALADRINVLKEELAERSEQLRQAQKMEAVGNLAGGIAHDFNNLLTVIRGNTELLLGTEIGQQPRDLAYEIIQASDRAGNLTRQLLAFSRREVVQPRVFDLNGLVSNLEQMLRRLIGEHILLDVELPDELSFVEADPGLVEQVIVNLSVNARDAMISGGHLMIRVGRKQLEADDPAWKGEFRPGRYVTLALSDDGSGIAPEIQERIFEPFFTTKEREQGTGLGLATVYGIVQQAGGLIRFESELGRGTTFEVFLPQCEVEPEAVSKFDGEPLAQPGNCETILLVEDETSILDVLSSNLEASGYKVLQAANGAEALAVMEEHRGEVDLLVSDVVMPMVSGPELYARLRGSHPHIKVIFISGYSNWSGRSGTLLPKDVPYLQKPFRLAELTKTVRLVLDDASCGLPGPP